MHPIPARGFLLHTALVASIAGCATPTGPGAVVFTSSRSGDGDLYVVDERRGVARPLTSDPVGEGGARHDRFGQRLVHQRFGPDGAELVADGEVLREDPSGDAGVSWSPADGSIVYARNDGGREDLWIEPADGSGARKLTDDAEVDRYPAWTPDGTRVVFVRQDVRGWDLFVVDVVGGKPERLTSEGVYVGHPAVSPDGRRVVFDTLVEGQTDVALLDLETGAVAVVCGRVGNDLAPAWSLDGERIAFGGVDPESGDWDLYELVLADGELTRLIDSPGFDGGPVYVPGGLVRARD